MHDCPIWINFMDMMLNERIQTPQKYRPCDTIYMIVKKMYI